MTDELRQAVEILKGLTTYPDKLGHFSYAEKSDNALALLVSEIEEQDATIKRLEGCAREAEKAIVASREVYAAEIEKYSVEILENMTRIDELKQPCKWKLDEKTKTYIPGCAGGALYCQGCGHPVEVEKEEP